MGSVGWLYLAEESSHAVLWAFFGGTAWVMWSLPVDADAFFCALLQDSEVTTTCGLLLPYAETPTSTTNTDNR